METLEMINERKKYLRKKDILSGMETDTEEVGVFTDKYNRKIIVSCCGSWEFSTDVKVEGIEEYNWYYKNDKTVLVVVVSEKARGIYTTGKEFLREIMTTAIPVKKEEEKETETELVDASDNSKAVNSQDAAVRIDVLKHRIIIMSSKRKDIYVIAEPQAREYKKQDSGGSKYFIGRTLITVCGIDIKYMFAVLEKLNLTCRRAGYYKKELLNRIIIHAKNEHTTFIAIKLIRRIVHNLARADTIATTQDHI